MKKAEFITLLAAKNSISRAGAQKILSAFLNAIEDGLVKDKRIIIRGFGSFTVKSRAKHSVHNISTGAPIEIPETNVVTFKAAQNLLEYLN